MNALSLFNDWLNNEDSGFSGSTNRFYVPEVDVTEKKDAYIIEMDLPGRSEKDIELELKEGELTIRSAVQNEKENKDAAKEQTKDQPVFLLKERTRAQFRRSFTLPKDIDAEAVSAGFTNGVLTVTIPRKEEAAPHRIMINIA